MVFFGKIKMLIINKSIGRKCFESPIFEKHLGANRIVEMKQVNQVGEIPSAIARTEP